jgi:hypothetical protein
MIRALRDFGLRAEQPTPDGVALVTVAVANVVLWVAARSAGQPTGRFRHEQCKTGQHRRDPECEHAGCSQLSRRELGHHP